MEIQFKEWACKINFAQYEGGNLAILLTDLTTGMPIAKATINVPGLLLADNQVVIKDYAENEGMLKALIDEGIVKSTGETVRVGHVNAPICEVLNPPNKHG